MVSMTVSFTDLAAAQRFLHVYNSPAFIVDAGTITTSAPAPAPAPVAEKAPRKLRTTPVTEADIAKAAAETVSRAEAAAAAAAPAPVPVAPAAPQDVAEAVTDAEVLDRDAARAYIVKLDNAKGRDVAMAVLKPFNATRVAEIGDEKLGAFCLAVKAALAAA